MPPRNPGPTDLGELLERLARQQDAILEQLARLQRQVDALEARVEAIEANT